MRITQIWDTCNANEKETNIRVDSEVTFRILLGPKVYFLIKPKNYYNNVGLQSIKGFYLLGSTLKNKDITNVCVSFIKRQLQNCYIKDTPQYKYMSLRDLSRKSKAFRYTYSSLYWLKQILTEMKKNKENITSSEYNAFNKMKKFHNKQVENSGELYKKKTGYKQYTAKKLK